MQSMNRPAFLAIKKHSPDKPVLVFVASRRQTRLTAADLVSLCGAEDDPRRFLHMSDDDLEANVARARDAALREALAFGIGLHHAGLVESDRAAGRGAVPPRQDPGAGGHQHAGLGRQPAGAPGGGQGHAVLRRQDGGLPRHGPDGRAADAGPRGRPQFDTSAVARIFTQDAKKDFYKHFLHTGFPVESSLHRVLADHLCAEVAAGTVAAKQDALDYLTWTFFFRRLHKNPSYYGLEMESDDEEEGEEGKKEKGGKEKGGRGGRVAQAQSATPQQRQQGLANRYMVTLVDRALDELAASRCVEVHADDGRVEATALGKIASYYYLSHRTMRHLAVRAERGADFATALAWMCRAAEYDELPVRHNEDLVNGELSRNLPLAAAAAAALGDLPLWDPHVKAFLLVQAHLSRLALPVADYVGDQTSVLDQAVRVAQAAVDVLAELGFLSSCLAMVGLLQAVKSARWPTDPPAAVLPGVEADGSSSSLPSPSLQRIAAMTAAQTAQLGRDLGVPGRLRADFSRAAARLPDVRVRASVTGRSLAVQLTRANAVAEAGGARVYAPRFPKPQTEGWFVVACDVAADEVLALKRVGWAGAAAVGSRPSASATLQLPRHGTGGPGPGRSTSWWSAMPTSGWSTGCWAWRFRLPVDSM